MYVSLHAGSFIGSTLQRPWTRYYKPSAFSPLWSRHLVGGPDFIWIENSVLVRLCKAEFVRRSSQERGVKIMLYTYSYSVPSSGHPGGRKEASISALGVLSRFCDWDDKSVSKPQGAGLFGTGSTGRGRVLSLYISAVWPCIPVSAIDES